MGIAVALSLAVAPAARAEQDGSRNGTAVQAPAGSQEEKDAPILLQAERLTYNSQDQIWTAEGKVEADRNGRILMADRVIYDAKIGEVIADGNVRLLEPGGQAVFAERVRLTDDLRAGIIHGLQFLMSKHARMAAARAVRRDGQVTTLDKAVFSTCDVCDTLGEPLWQLKASEVTHDQNQREVIYRNVSFEIYGVPVLWTPYFSHPDPTVERKTGFLTPSVGNTTELGSFVELPYYIVLKPNMDLTLSPKYTTEEGVVGNAEFRHRTSTGKYELSGSITHGSFLKGFITKQRTDNDGNPVFDDDGNPVTFTEPDTDDRYRGHLFGEAKFQTTRTTQWGGRLELTTDDTYLRRYDVSNKDRLVNNVYVNRFKERDYTSHNSFYFDGLREEDDPGQTPIIPALVENRFVFNEPVLDGQVSLDANALSLIRTEGQNTQRLSLSGKWERRFVSAQGEVISAFALARGDGYYTNAPDSLTDTQPADPMDPGPMTGSSGTVAALDTGFQTRVLGAVGVDWRLPFVRSTPSSQIIVEPIAQLIYSPPGGNPDEIPNEDSASFEFDDTNLFSLNKFPGLDRWESGPRANVGLRMAAYTPGGLNTSLLFGQSFRLAEEDAFEEGSGLESKQSDYVGRLTLKKGKYAAVTHRFRIDRKSFSVRRNEVDVHLQPTDGISLRNGYLFLDETAGQAARQEWRAEGEVRLTENWAINLSGRRDLEQGEWVRTRASLLYGNECTEFELAFQERFTVDRDVRPDQSFIFRFRLTGMGS